MRLPKELNSQVPGNQAEPYADTTLESPLNGRRRCTNIVDVLIVFLPTGVVVIPVGF